MCPLAALDSQGIVVKCTAAIFFRTVDWPGWRSKIIKKKPILFSFSRLLGKETT